MTESAMKAAQKIVDYIFDDYPDNDMNRRQLIDHVAALIKAEYPSVTEWHPIETAPDQQWILIHCPRWDNKMQLHWWTHGKENQWLSDIRPTLWRSVPVPPKEK